MNAPAFLTVRSSAREIVQHVWQGQDEKEDENSE